MSKEAVLLIGNFRPTLAAARALGRLGYSVYVAAEPNSSGAEHSRFVDRVFPFPDPAEGVQSFKAALLDCIGKHSEVGYLLPMKENVIELLDACRASVPETIHLATPSHDALEICLDKLSWLKFCKEIGIPCPAFDFASNQADLKRVIDEIGGPVVVRPVEAGKRIWHRKAITLQTAAQVDVVFRSWPEGLKELLIQQRFEGERYNIQFAARDGRVLAEQHSYSIRTDRIDGTGQTIEGQTIPAVRIHSQMLAQVVGAMRYSGVGNAQFLYDQERDEACFLEINPRFGASHSYTEYSGFNLTELALQISDPTCEPRPVKPRAHVRFVWTYGDLHGLMFSLKAGDLTKMEALKWIASSIKAALLCDCHVTWSWQDPRPAAIIYTRRFIKALGLSKE
jgi:biotin carboxylase